MMAADLGVVIVSYRSRTHLPACLEALPAAAAELGLEIVIVDNASGDDTVEWLAATRPDVRVLQNATNRGFAAAVNQGMRETRAECVLLLNPDARPAPGSIARLLCELQQDQTVGLAAPQLFDPDGTPQVSAWRAPGLGAVLYDGLLLHNLFPLRARLARAAADVDCLSGACLLVRRSCFAACNGCDEGFFLYHEDFDLCLRARAAGWRVRLVPEARAVHIKGASAFLDPALFWRHYHASRLRLLRKHHPPGWGRVLAALYTAGVVVRSAVTAAAGLVTGRAELRARARCHAEALRAIRNAEV